MVAADVAVCKVPKGEFGGEATICGMVCSGAVGDGSAGAVAAVVGADVGQAKGDRAATKKRESVPGVWV